MMIVEVAVRVRYFRDSDIVSQFDCEAIATSIRISHQMTSKRLAVFCGIMSVAIIGCGGSPEKVTPKVTPEMKAEQDKAHAQVKAKMETPPANTAK